MKTPTLHNALPAIEILHAAWTKAAAKHKYHAFAEALEAATEKLDEYYQKTAASDAHIMAMGTSLPESAVVPSILILYHRSPASRSKDGAFSQILGR